MIVLLVVVYRVVFRLAIEVGAFLSGTFSLKRAHRVTSIRMHNHCFYPLVHEMYLRANNGVSSHQSLQVHRQRGTAQGIHGTNTIF